MKRIKSAAEKIQKMSLKLKKTDRKKTGKLKFKTGDPEQIKYLLVIKVREILQTLISPSTCKFLGYH